MNNRKNDYSAGRSSQNNWRRGEKGKIEHPIQFFTRLKLMQTQIFYFGRKREFILFRLHKREATQSLINEISVSFLYVVGSYTKLRNIKWLPIFYFRCRFFKICTFYSKFGSIREALYNDDFQYFLIFRKFYSIILPL